MNIIFKGRGYGKTLELIKKSAETGGYIVCRSIHDAAQIQHQAKQFGLKIPFPISYGEFIEKQYYGKGVKSFLIDNAEDLLQQMTAVKIDAITLSKND